LPPEPPPDQASQPTPQSAPPMNTSMPPTSNEFVQQVLARLSHSVRPAPDREYP
jgi:hypothetical protein